MRLAGMDTSSFERSLQKARIESDDLTKKMQEDSAKEFSLIRTFLKAEEAKTKEQEKMLDRMKDGNTLLADADTPLGIYVSEMRDISAPILDKHRRLQETRQKTNYTAMVDSSGIDREIASIQGQVGRLFAATTVASAAPAGTAAGYAPNYE